MEISLNLRAEDLTSEGCRLTRGHLVIGIQLRQKPFPFMPPRGKGEGNSWGCWGSVGLVYVCLACVVSVRLRIWRLASVVLEHLHSFFRRAPERRFFHPDGEIRFSRVLGSSFLSGFGHKFIRRSHAIPGPPGSSRGLRTKQKRVKRRGNFPRV
jgi:hypothetical protein